MKTSCDCGRTLHPAKLYPLYCACGRKHDGDELPEPSQCQHRGERIGRADCGCAGSPAIYHCSIHGLAMEHKLKPGKVRATIGGEKQCVEMAYCSFCPDDTRELTTDPR